MANLPTDTLLEEILPRCNAKSLLKFKYVCKSFNTLISSSKFINLHLRYCCYNPNRFLVLDYGRQSRIPNGICWVDVQSFESHQLSPLPLPKISTSNKNRGGRHINIVGSCNGLLCVALNDIVRDIRVDDILFVLLNPCTGMYARIPRFKEIHEEIRHGHPYIVRSMQFGFGYDPMNCDYKVVAIVDCNIVVNENFLNNVDVANEITREVFVYSKNFKSWRLVECTSSSRDGVLGGNNGVVINGHLLHWVFECSDNKKTRIGCFDLRIDQWVQDVPLPDYYKNNVTNWLNFADDNRIEVLHIGVLDRSLCLLTENPRNVWIMKAYGVRESWVKLLGDSDSQITKSLTLCPLAYRGVTSNEVLVTRINQRKRTELVWYNIAEKKIQRVDQIYKSRKVYDVLNAYVCEPTLVELPGGLKIEAAANKGTDVSDDDRYWLKKYEV